jgi:hypothetical protein
MFCGYRISLLLRMPRHIMPCSTREEIYLGIPLIISIFRLSQWFVFFLKTINVPPPKKKYIYLRTRKTTETAAKNGPRGGYNRANAFPHGQGLG